MIKTVYQRKKKKRKRTEEAGGEKKSRGGLKEAVEVGINYHTQKIKIVHILHSCTSIYILYIVVYIMLYTRPKTTNHITQYITP